jgi:iduronate 2-sulfatase
MKVSPEGEKRSRWAPLFAALLGLAAASGARAEAPAKGRLNVLFIAADDLNVRLGCYGAPYVKTPNVDRLAARGVRFDRAFCQYPVCNGSRTSLLSGLYPETTRVYANNQDPRETLPDAVFLPEMFKQNGYFIAAMGKIAHGSFPDAVKWDVFENPRGGGDDDEGPAPAATTKAQRREAAKKAAAKKGAAGKAATKKAARLAAGDGLPFPWKATDNGDEAEPDGHDVRRIAALLEEHKDGPFFLAAGLHKPHVPHQAPKRYFDLYRVEEMPLAPRGGDPLPRLAPGKFFPELTEDQQRQIIAHYTAVTSFMDAQVGVLLDAMDRLKLWDSTLVVYWSDHGWHLGEHGGTWAKFTVLDESARVPLIVAGPGIRPAVARGQVELVDLYPTLADLCRLSPPPGLQGRSFADALAHPDAPGKDVAYTVVSRGQKLARAIRTPGLTYIAYPDGTEQLFAASDVHEMDNLADDPKHADDLAAMKRHLEQAKARATR